MTDAAAFARRETAPEHATSNGRRILIVAYHFPPEPAAGSLRPSYLARYLPQFGWEPTVLTKAGNGLDAATIAAPDILERHKYEHSQKAIPREGRRGFSSRLRDLAKSMMFFPDRAAGWIPGAIATGLRAARCRRFDAVLSTGPPHSAHIVAFAIAQLQRIAWIADYRDLWHASPYGTVKGELRKSFERRIEAMLRRCAAAITAVDHELIMQQERVYGTSFAEVIPAAYDPAEWESVADPEPSGFRLCYAGTLYGGRRRLDLLLDAIASLRALAQPAGMAARVDYYGPDAALVQQLAEQRGLGDAVESHGHVGHADVLVALRRAAVLLIILDMRQATISRLGSKIFEYIGAKRPILAIGPTGSAVQHFIARHRIGWFASDAIEAQAALRAAYKAVANGSARRMSNGVGETILTARDVAARFAALLDVVTAGGQRRTLYRPAKELHR
ncbi:MAG TPA: glycosyltransferase [Patescibacteria group bacterium]|nr:glycosyltransferase [Patescibacteria group bacterium]